MIRPTPPQVGEGGPPELSSTEVGAGTARALAAAFLALLVGVPLFQAWREARSHQPIQALDLLRNPPHLLQDFDLAGDRNPLKTYERTLADASIPKRSVQPVLQEVLSGTFGAGNAKVVLGRDGWLFYRATLDYVSGHGFLSPSPARNGNGAPRVEPLPVIERFQADCKAAGVRLILVPIPEKNQIYPEKVSDVPAGELEDNPDARRFWAELKSRGIEVFDPIPTLQAAAKQGLAFLPRDTHWTPEGMDAVARALAELIRPAGPFLPRQGWVTRAQPRQEVGDLVHNLILPATQSVFAPMQVTIEQVITPQGELWRPDPGAEVILLGDSHTNIYSQQAMGWGEAAGLGAHVALHLGSGVDTIAVNAGCATECRRQLAARPDPLGGKKVLIWEFGVRDLAEPDWEVVPLHSKPRPPPAALPADGALQVIAELVTRPGLPPPDTLYANARVFLKYRVRRVLAGTYSGSELLVQVPILSNRSPLPSLKFRVGELHLLTLSEKVPPEWEGQPVVDETGDYDHTAYWAVRVEPAPDP